MSMFLEKTHAHNLNDTCKLFANHFSSVYVKNNLSNDILESLSVKIHDLNINSMSITENEISDYLLSINDKSSIGPDGIPPIFKKKCYSVLVKPLHYLFNLSLSTGVFPSFWKKSFITPIHKSGSKIDISNYRPISKFSSIPKLFEAIISKKLSSILLNYISPTQHGFLAKQSIFTNLLVYQNYLTNALDEGLQVDALYTDFQKPFDKVDHILLYYLLY